MLNKLFSAFAFFILSTSVVFAKTAEQEFECPFLFEAGHNISTPITQGKEGWFFRANELKENFELLPETATFLSRMQKAFAAQNATLILMEVPVRSLGSPDKLLKDQPIQNTANPALSLVSYKKYLSQLAATGNPVVDMTNVVRKRDEKTNQSFFLRRDIHWSPFGANLAAKAVAERIKALPDYALEKPVIYETKITGLLAKKDIFARELQDLCSDILPAEEFPAYTTTATLADAVAAEGEDALFGDDASAAPPIVLLGSSFSAVKDFNFEGFLAEHTQQEIANFAISAGELFNAIVSYVSLPKADRLSPDYIVWENLAHYDLNQGERLFRQIIPAIHGECSTQNAIAHQTLNIEKGKAAEVFTLPAKLAVHGSDYYFYVHSDNLGLARFTLNLDYADGDGEVFTIDRTEHFNNTGRFFAELSDEITTPLTKIGLSGMNNLNATVEVRLCKTHTSSPKTL